LSAHDEALKVGGVQGVLDLGLIESAIARPYCGYYPKISQKAAALVHSFATNHGFLDGNKRTTLILLSLLLEKSGYQFTMSGGRANKELEQVILSVVRRETTFDKLVQWFDRRLARIATAPRHGR
jgi:death on curing protein